MLYYASFSLLSIQNTIDILIKKKPRRNSLSMLSSSKLNSVYDKPRRK